MAFKHVKQVISTANSFVTLYTVPTGKEFVLTNKRACSWNIATGATATITIANGSNTTLATLTVDNSLGDSMLTSTDNVVDGSNYEKTLFAAGQSIKGKSSVAGAMVEIIGLELDAGTWTNVNQSNS